MEKKFDINYQCWQRGLDDVSLFNSLLNVLLAKGSGVEPPPGLLPVSGVQILILFFFTSLHGFCIPLKRDFHA